MNLVASDIKKVLEDNNIVVSDIEKINIGGANINYKFFSESKCYVAKCYQRDYYFHLSNMLIERLNEYDSNLVIHDRKIIDKPFRIEVTKFHKGNHIFSYNATQIKRILEIINFYTQEKYNIDISTNETIYEKFNNYYNYFIKNISNLKKVSKRVIENLFFIYTNLDIDNNPKMCIIHGDLSNTNILWNDSTPTILDFDECIYAEKEYEIASFIVKSAFNNGLFDLNIARNIIKYAKEVITNFDIKKINKYIKFYILKVLFEKLYFYETTDLDIESDEQKKDYWLWWYKLLLNNQFDDIIK